MSHIATGSAKAPLTHVSDYTRDLDYLHHADRESDVLDREVARVCTAVFGASLYEIGDQRFVDLLNESEPYAFKDAAIAFALKNGFNIAHPGGLLPLRDWRSFAIMVMAKAHGFLTPDAEGVGRSLRSDAARFQQLKIADDDAVEGEVLWFDSEKGFGFIRPFDADGNRPNVWVGMSEITRSGLDVPHAGQWLSFSIGHDRQNRPRATDLKRIRLYRRDVVERHFGSLWGERLTTEILFA